MFAGVESRSSDVLWTIIDVLRGGLIGGDKMPAEDACTSAFVSYLETSYRCSKCGCSHDEGKLWQLIHSLQAEQLRFAASDSQCIVSIQADGTTDAAVIFSRLLRHISQSDAKPCSSAPGMRSHPHCTPLH